MSAISYHITFKQYEFPIMLQDYASLPKEAIHMNTKIHNWYIFLIHLWTKNTKIRVGVGRSLFSSWIYKIMFNRTEVPIIQITILSVSLTFR